MHCTKGTRIIAARSASRLLVLSTWSEPTRARKPAFTAAEGFDKQDAVHLQARQLLASLVRVDVARQSLSARVRCRGRLVVQDRDGYLRPGQSLRVHYPGQDTRFVERSTSRYTDMLHQRLAERKGFEPLKPLRAYVLSRDAPSTTRPPLQVFFNFAFAGSESPLSTHEHRVSWYLKRRGGGRLIRIWTAPPLRRGRLSLLGGTKSSSPTAQLYRFSPYGLHREVLVAFQRCILTRGAPRVFVAALLGGVFLREFASPGGISTRLALHGASAPA